jgi:RNA polymerase-binding protein DksA
MGYYRWRRSFMEAAAIKTRPEIERLEKQRTETQEELERLQLELRSLAEPSADEADLDAYEREKTWALVQRMRQKLQSIDGALALAQSGAYGICQSCGERIEPARLEILPEATLCLTCQREYERRNKRR